MTWFAYDGPCPYPLDAEIRIDLGQMEQEWLGFYWAENGLWAEHIDARRNDPDVWVGVVPLCHDERDY